MTGCNSEPPARDGTFHFAAPNFLDSFGQREFRQNHSRRRGGHGSHCITIHVCSCRSVSHLEMCSFLHGSTFPRCLRYRLGLLAVDPKLGEKKWRLRMPRSVHTSFVRAEAIKSFGDTGPRNRAPANQDEARGESPCHKRREKNHTPAPSDTSLLTGR